MGNKRIVFHGNPWGLTWCEAKVMWLLTVIPPRDIGPRLGLTTGGVRAHLCRSYRKMGSTHCVAAAIDFDRWWQGAKRHVDDETLLLFEVDLLQGLV